MLEEEAALNAQADDTGYGLANKPNYAGRSF